MKPDELNDTVSASETNNNMVKNSLYYLEHENSQLRSLNKPLQQKFMAAPNQSNNRSGILGLNITNAAGNTYLANSILNMSKNTAFQNLNKQDQSSYLQRYQDPPSQSRILQMDDIMQQSTSGVESSIQRDEEISGILAGKFNKSILGGLDPSEYSKMTKNSNVFPYEMDASMMLKGLHNQGV